MSDKGDQGDAVFDQDSKDALANNTQTGSSEEAKWSLGEQTPSGAAFDQKGKDDIAGKPEPQGYANSGWPQAGKEEKKPEVKEESYKSAKWPTPK